MTELGFTSIQFNSPLSASFLKIRLKLVSGLLCASSDPDFQVKDLNFCSILISLFFGWSSGGIHRNWVVSELKFLEYIALVFDQVSELSNRGFLGSGEGRVAQELRIYSLS